MTKKTVTDRLTKQAKEYFGGDVQRFWIMVSGKRGEPRVYTLWQDPHWLPRRVAASVIAFTHREAARKFNSMAKER